VLRHLVDDEGVAVLAVSHDRRLNAVADRLLRLDHGKISAVTRTDAESAEPAEPPGVTIT
jgi:ABC-type sulfate/molybdate transport systems ATPase subunit